VQYYKLPTQPTPHPRTLLLADGKTTDKITEYIILPVSIGNHNEYCLFFVTNLADNTPVIFGLPWLKRHNPYIDWAAMSLTFNSWYCLSHCCPQGLQTPPTAPTIPDLSQSFHDLPVPGEPRTKSSTYQSPYCEEAPEEECNKGTNENAISLHIDATLTPGQQHYRTYCPTAANGTVPECRALMIPNRPNSKPTLARVIAGTRQKGKPLIKQPLPPLSVPLPQPSPVHQEPPNLADIRMSAAVNFLQFCRDPKVKAMKVTWNELDNLADKETKPTSFMVPDLPDQVFQNILNSSENTAQLRMLFPEEFHDFLDECRTPLRLRGVSEADIAKFMQGKPDLQKEDLLKLLPPWLSDLYEGFLPRLADQLPPRRAWDHKIELMPGKEPPYLKNRPFSPPELRVIRKWLDDNLGKGFIRESKARCAAPLLLAAKPGGGVRICQDYRGLNNVTIKNRYPLPLIRETLDALCNAKVYTKLDIIAAFNKLRIAEGHEWKTAFITRFGLFESLVMPFGLCNAPASFQNYINHILYDLLDNTCTAYLDDVLIYSANRKDHRKDVREVIQRLIEAGLQIDIHKCEFETTKTKYLGLIVSPGGIQMDPVKVKTIRDWLPPPSLKDLQKFLGFANFYRRFIRGFSKIAAPLNKLLTKNSPWRWDDEHQHAFDDLKTAFTTAPVLAMFDYTRRTVLETDASDWASGGVLSQYDDNGILRPIAYFSSKHSSQECNYEIYDKELLAIIKALEEWRPELQGIPDPFEIITDHKNLEYFTSTKALNQRQVRWSEFLSQFNFRIVYRPGSRAARPDALSRKPGDRPAKTDLDDDRIKNRLRTVLPPERFDADVLQELLQRIDQDQDPAELFLAPIDLILPAMDKPIDELIDQAYTRSDLAMAMLSSLRDPLVRRWPKALRKELRVPMVDCKVVGNRIYYRDRLFAPPDDELRTQILYRTHSSGPAGHPGRIKTLELITRDYWWPRMSRDVEEYVKACELCVRTKAPRTAPQGFLQPLPIPFRAWSDLSIDYITPLPVCERDGRQYKHILVVVCRLTKMRHFIPVTGLSAEELADVFINRIYCLHGLPDNIVSDRGTQFISEFWHHLSERLGVKLKHSSAFHPETDGQTERVNSGIEQYLRAFMNFHQNDWVQWLPLAEFAANNVISETTGVSPFFANYGFNPRLGVEPSKPCPPNLNHAQKRQFYRVNVIADRFERIITQLKALAQQSVARYEEYANESREDALHYQEGDKVYIDTRNMKTNRPMKKGDDKMSGPFLVKKVYPRACLIDLPPNIKVFPVFHNSLLRPCKRAVGLPGQRQINEAESRHLRGRILERDDDTDEMVEKWEFEALLDCHNDYGSLQYLVKWKHHAPTWQPATDLKGQDEVILEFHRTHPNKPGPPSWVKRTKRAHSGRMAA
jgi:hypothetical protein